MIPRIGEGFDRHRLEEGRSLVLGGVSIEHSKGLAGHSDGDALLHSVCDALLGAAALGDLGGMFSDTDPAHRDRDSREFLAEVRDRVLQHGFSIGNVDATIVAEEPRLAPHVDSMRQNLATILQIDVDCVSVKATRGEGMGPEGRAEAITVRSVALIFRPASNPPQG